MLLPKRFSFLLAAILVVSTLGFLAVTLKPRETIAQSKQTAATLKSKILRRKDRLNLPMSFTERALLRAQAVLKEERQLENQIPDHVPIKVKIKTEKEKAFKDIDNAHWARDFELEVKNTGTKPIYHFVLLLLFPDPLIGGGNMVMTLHYGPSRLSAFNDPIALPEEHDIPILPGATYTVRIPKGQVEGWEDSTEVEQWPAPKKVVVEFEQITFGDRTGLIHGGFTAVPQSRSKSGLLNCPSPFSSLHGNDTGRQFFRDKTSKD